MGQRGVPRLTLATAPAPPALPLHSAGSVQLCSLPSARTWPGSHLHRSFMDLFVMFAGHLSLQGWGQGTQSVMGEAGTMDRGP